METKFTQTDINLIPEDWKFIPLGDEKYFKSINGLWKGKKPPFTEVNVIRNTNFTHFGIIDFSDVAVLDVEEKQYINRKLIPGDIIIERSGGGPTQPVGRVVFFNIKEGEFCFSNFTSCLRTLDRNVFIPKFVFYSLLNFYLSGKTDSLQARTTGIRNLNFTSYKEEAKVPHISLAEQKKIAHILSKIQQAIETQEQIIRTTQELKKALMHKLFTEGINSEPQKQTEIGLIPESWGVVPLKDAVSYIDYGLSEAIPKNQDFEGIRNVSTADINREGKLLYYKVRKVQTTDRIIERLKLKDGDVLFNWRNSSELIGKTTIYLEQPETHIFASFILRIRCDEIKYHNYFLAYLMNHYRERGIFIQLSRRAVNQANYNRNEIYVLKIPMPSFDEQVNIANAYRKIDEKIELLNIELSNFKELFNNVLNQLMTGQIRVKDIKFKLEKTEYS